MNPALHSLAFRDIPRPDFADVVVCPLPEGASLDPAVWATAIFDVRESPRWVLALLSLRQAVVGLIGVPKAGPRTFAISEVVGEEALISTDEAHLDFRAGVGVDAEGRLLRVTTVVRLKNRRGRLYFAPVQLLHGPVTRAMVHHAIRRRPTLA